MLSIKDCLDYCDLLEEHVSLLAEHNDISKQLAVHIACGLVQTPEGIRYLSDCMLCAIEKLRVQGEFSKVKEAEAIYASFIVSHPLPPP